jgi:hypothetical protein
MLAGKVRERIVEQLTAVVTEEDFSERGDARWIYATLANCLRALGRDEEAQEFEDRFRTETEVDWEVKTYERAKGLILEYKSMSDRN